MSILIKPPDVAAMRTHDPHPVIQHYTAAEGDMTLTITLPSPGADWYGLLAMANWNTTFHFNSQSKGGCVLGYSVACPPGGGEVLVVIFH